MIFLLDEFICQTSRTTDKLKTPKQLAKKINGKHWEVTLFLKFMPLETPISGRIAVHIITEYGEMMTPRMIQLRIAHYESKIKRTNTWNIACLQKLRCA